MRQNGIRIAVGVSAVIAAVLYLTIEPDPATLESRIETKQAPPTTLAAGDRAARAKSTGGTTLLSIAEWLETSTDQDEPDLPALSEPTPAQREIDSALGIIKSSEREPADVALRSLRPLFTHRIAAVRLAAYEALADLEHPLRVDSLAQALFDPEPNIRIAALDALSTTVDKAALPYLELGLADPQPEVRIAALEGLVDHDPERVLPGLAAMLNDPEIEVRRHAVGALGEIGGTEVLPYLRQASYDPDLDTREIAQSILHEYDIER